MSIPSFPVIVRVALTGRGFLITNRAIANLLLLVLLWTGTLLHDMMETADATPAVITNQRVAGQQDLVQCQSSTVPEAQFANTEQHFHDAAISLKNGSDVGWSLSQSCQLPVLSRRWTDYKVPVHARLQRPPPLCVTGLPTRTFMVKRALLV